jgi:hypothetical protein
MPDLRDRHGLTLTTQSPAAAEQYVLGLDRQLSLNAGGVEALTAAVTADPNFAAAYAALGYAQWYRQDVPAAKASIAQARALVGNTTPREQQHVELVGKFVDGSAGPALPLMHEYLASYPRDGLIVHLTTQTIGGSGRVGRRQENFDLLAGLAPAWGDDWWFQGAFAFAHHEVDLLDEARRLAEHSLKQQPRNATGAHPLAHVFFESNNHGDGRAFLGPWIAEYDRAAPFFCHLSWHLALFELAQGNTERVLELYDATISPAASQQRTTLLDSASLLWRYELYGCQPQIDLPWGEVCAYAAKVAPTPGMAFPDSHVTLVLAAMRDDEALSRLIAGFEALAASRPLFSEVILPLARGIQAFSQGAYDDAVRWIEPLDGQFVRIGGSHAQWEVFEDTLLQAYLRSGRFEHAEALLRRRLAQRSSARDVVWLEQATATRAAETAS